MPKLGKIPEQALPPDKRRKPLPPPFHDTLPSGLAVDWRMPDPLAIVAFDGTIPDPITAAVIKLLDEEKLATHETSPNKLRYSAQAQRGMYGLAAAMLEHPKLDLSVEYGDDEGTLGRREIGYGDVVQLYWFFRIGARAAARQPADPSEPQRPENAALDRDGVRGDAGAPAGD